MHRWGQSQMFRSLASYVNEARKAEKLKAEALEGETVEARVIKNLSASISDL
jgi:hypothetical protein